LSSSRNPHPPPLLATGLTLARFGSPQLTEQWLPEIVTVQL
jgi:hypothetical protein